MSHKNTESSVGGGEAERRMPKDTMDEFLGKIKSYLKEEMEPMNRRLSQLEISMGKGKRTVKDEDDDFGDESFDENWERGIRNYGGSGTKKNIPRRRLYDDDLDDNMSDIKMKIPTFHGKSDPEAYIEWEKRADFIFECHNYSEIKKVKLAVVEFTDYALIWWDQLVLTRRRSRERPIESWDDMKVAMRKRFVPNHYYREMYNRLQGLRQGSRSVEDYHKEMEVLLIRTNTVEDEEATMARFLCGLNREIQDQVELRPYHDLEEMAHMAIKVEKQLKRRGIGRSNTMGSQSNPWRPNLGRKDDGKVVTKPKPELKSEPPRQGPQGKSEPSLTRARDIKCFKCQGAGHIASQCPNKRVMKINAYHDLESESERDEEGSEYDDMPELEDTAEDVEAVVGRALVTRRLLSIHPKEEESSQRENLFHTRCLVNDRMCNVIIDGGSCTNVASWELVEKLGLPTLVHPQPYNLQWLNDCAEVRVNRQVLVSFTMGRYVDKVLCDVVPMHACHILLGRPWQYDRKAIHDGYTNKYSFSLNNKSITLVPLSPKQVLQDHIEKLKREEAEKKREKEKSEVASSEKEKEKERVEKKSERKSEMAQEKKKSVKKSESKENEWKEAKKKSLMAQKSDFKFALHTQAPLVLLTYKEILLNTSDIAGDLPSVVTSLLQDFEDVFPDDLPQGLPP